MQPGKIVAPHNLDKNWRLNQTIFMQYYETETKNKEGPCFAQVRHLLTKLCDIFHEAFLFDVSLQHNLLQTSYCHS